ncbi:MAG TPA: TIGR04283 family arsenosugar biosynthesis glycosyltransferase, partial [Casimicrobiaceae bacterium]|nr:TIGR04283 family arsenosugar biosynthesis glycosyltransferase [Casimicrobiaceae bacterium]
MPPLPISIIVPTLDEAAHIRVALEALGSLRDCGHEVIVVDGGSVDETFAIAQPHADHALAAPRGRAIQMNVGASVARGRVLLFLHADCRLPQPALRAIGEAHAAGHRWGRFDVELVGRSRLLRLVATTMNERSALTGIATGDQAIFVDRALFDRVGGFPPIPLMEDIAISKRLRATAGKPARLRQPVRASGRRWDAHGASRTIASMAGLRFAYWRGVDPELLARRYYGRSAHRRATLVIFAKAPVPGRVKTRLATAIGATEATAVYRELVQKTLDDAVAARRAGVV